MTTKKTKETKKEVLNKREIEKVEDVTDSNGNVEEKVTFKDGTVEIREK